MRVTMSASDEEHFSDSMDDFLVDDSALEAPPSDWDFPPPAKKRRLDAAASQPFDDDDRIEENNAREGTTNTRKTRQVMQTDVRPRRRSGLSSARPRGRQLVSVSGRAERVQLICVA